MSLAGRQGEADRPAGAVGVITPPWCHSRRESGRVLHARRAVLQIPLFGRPRRFVVRPDRSAVKKRHAQVNAALLDVLEKPFPDAQLAPADEGLGARHQGTRSGGTLRHFAPF